jgi:hypothetical protein
VLGRIHYLLVPETEFNRIKKDAEENKTRADELELSIDALKK